MATRDILVLNTTASRAETQQGSDTVIIRGQSETALSVENSSGVSVLSVNTVSSSVDVAGKITATGNVSSSLTSTGSFGRIEAKTLVGSAFDLSNSAILGTISSSGQIANQISGAFRQGFEFTGTIGDTIPDQQNKITASFGRIVATSLSGSAANLINTQKTNTISSSAQIASQISGAFTSGFNYDGKISGSVASTGSFTRIDAITLVGDGTELTNIASTNTISGSAQIASQISGAFTSGFNFDGTIQGISVGDDFVTNGTFASDSGWTKETGWTITGGKAVATNAGATYTISQTSAQTITANTTYRVTYTMSDFSSSPSGLRIRIGNQLLGTGRASNGTFVEDVTTGGSVANQVIGFYSSGGSNTFKIDDVKFQKVSKGVDSISTGSFGRLEATTLVGDVSGMSNLLKTEIVSGSAQLATAISGSFTSGFEYVGVVSGSATSTGSFNTTTVGKAIGNISGMTNIVPSVVISGSKQIASRISGSFNKGFEFDGTIQTSPAAWSLGVAYPNEQSNIGGVAVGQSPNAMLAHYGTDGNVFNGSSWSEITAAPSPTFAGVATGDYDAALMIGGNRSGSISWNGSSWSAEGSTNRANTYLASGAGTTEAALVFGGGSGSNDSIGHVSNQTELYNGSSWSEVNDMLIPKYKGSQTGIGSSNSTISYGGCGQAKTYDPPSPFSEFAISDPRQEGTHLEEWNGTNWSYLGDFYAHPQPSFFNHSGAGVGTTNAASFYGGYTHHFGGGGMNSTHYHWDGTAMSNGVSMLIPKTSNDGAGQGGVTGAHSSIFAWYSGYGGSHPTYGAAAIGAHEQYEVFYSTGSFGRAEATSMHGDISNMTDTAKTGFLSSSVQIADRISGSFKGGISTTGGHIGYGGVWSVGTAATDGGGSGLSLTSNAMFGNNNAAGVVTGNRSSAPWGGTYTYFAHYQYNGTNWSQSPHHLNYSRAGSLVVGQQEAAFRWGGGAPGSHLASECYNGSSWTQQSEMVWHNSSIGNGFGESSNAAAQFGGSVPTYYCEHKELGISYDRRNCFHQEWDGTSWFVMPGNKIEFNLGGYGSSGGSVNSAFFYTTPHQMCAHKNSPKMFETWDGVSWKQETKVPPKLLNFPIGFGTANDAVIAGGTYIPYYPNTVNPNSQEDTYAWDGVSWKVDGAKMNQPRQGGDAVSNFGGGIGTSNALAGGGGMHPAYGTYCNQTEHYDRGNGIPTTGSFFEVTASSAFSADLTLASGISFPVGTLSGSAQIANRVSGSFNQRYVFDGNFGGGGGTWYATGFRTPYYEARYSLGGGTVNAGWMAGGNTGAYPNYLWEKFDGMSWSDGGGQMLKPRCGLKGGGAQNAAVAFGGYHASPTTNHSTCTEELNGITWSEVNNLATAKGLQQGGWGEQTAALSIGGDSSPSAVTEQYDGLNWSNQVSTPHPITQYYDGTGTVNAGGQFVGTACGPAPTSPNYYWNEWNGSTWSEGNKNISPKEHFAMFGNANSAVIYGGRNANTGGGAKLVEEYDGTGWSILSSLPRTNSYTTGNGIGGSSAAGIAAGGQWAGGGWNVYKGLPMSPTGYPAARSMNLSFAFERNLTCVVNTHTASIADEPFMQNRYAVSASIDSEHHNECSRIGNVTADTLQMKNNTDIQVEESMQMPIFYSNPPVTSSAGEVWYNATEEKLYFTYDINSWSEVSGLNQARNLLGVVGNEGEAMAAGGAIPAITCTELWNGITWTEVNDMVDANASYGIAGNACAAIYQQTYPFGTTKNQCWNGTNWSEVADGGYAASNKQGDGTANAAIFSGGHTPSNTAAVSEWNGSVFYDGPNMPTAKTDHAQAGFQNAAYVFGGNAPASPSTETVKYDGTSWATDVNLPQGIRAHTGSGTSNAALSAAGSEPATTANTNEYNGVAWHAGGALSSARKYTNMDGTQAGTIIAGGSPSGALTEIYTTTGIGCACIGGV